MVVIKAMFGFWNMVLYIVVFKSLVLLISCQKVGQVVYRFHLNILWSSSFSRERHMTTRYIEILNDIIVIVGLLNPIEMSRLQSILVYNFRLNVLEPENEPKFA